MNINFKKVYALEIVENPQEVKDLTLSIRVIGGGGYDVTLEAESLDELKEQYWELIDEIYAYKLVSLSLDYKGRLLFFDQWDGLIDFILNE